MNTKIANAVKQGLRSPTAKRAPRAAPQDDEVVPAAEKTANELDEALWDEIEGKGAGSTQYLDAAPILRPDPMTKTAAASKGVQNALDQAPDWARNVIDAVERSKQPPTPGGFRDILPNLGNSLRTIVTGKGEISGAQRTQLGLVGALGGVALGTAYFAARERAKQRQYDAVMAHILKSPDMQDSTSWRSVVPEAYAFMQRYAPSLAQDPSLAKAFCRTVNAGDKDDFLNYGNAKLLADAEKAYHESGSASGAMRDIENLMRHPVSKAVGFGGGGGKK